MGDTITAADLDACDREPIHIPGSIQPHGVMLVAGIADLRVTHAAGDAEGWLGTGWQNAPLSALVGDAIQGKIAAVAEQGSAGFVGQMRTAAGRVLDVSAHRIRDHVIVEFERASDEVVMAATVLDGLETAAGEFARTASMTRLCERAAVEFRALTGFDRVMVYHFLEDGAGRVVAEDRREDLHSFLHQHFPATDIPRQAMALYLHNLVRVIPDVSYQPAPLRPQWTEPAPLDMSDCSLRSVSPIHLQYLRNMGVSASASFSIVKDGTLWGLIACHNETPHFIDYVRRAACRSLVGGLARQIRAKEEADGYRQRIRLRSFEDDVVGLLSREEPLGEMSPVHMDEISRMMAGDGVAILRGHTMAASGVCPPDGEIRALAGWLCGRTADPVFSTDQLSEHYPAAGSFQASGSGVLAVTVSADEPWVVMWFRAEQIQTVNWAGNPHKNAGPGIQALSPRASFDAWAETVRGRSRRWSVPEVDAAVRVREALLEVQQQRRLRELNAQLTKILQDKDSLLQQKEFLIGEVNHRVQNSLQLVSSFLAMQARSSDNADLHTALEEARRRLTAVALVHRRLYRGNQVERVDGARYIEELCADTFAFMGQDWSRQLTLNLSPVLISTDRAVTMGLVLTELMINANKYAYGGAAGPIEVELSETGTHIQLAVGDKGVGKQSSRKGFGSRVMDGLVQQLGGVLTHRDNRPGLLATLTVPIQDPAKP